MSSLASILLWLGVSADVLVLLFLLTRLCRGASSGPSRECTPLFLSPNRVKTFLSPGPSLVNTVVLTGLLRWVGLSLSCLSLENTLAVYEGRLPLDAVIGLCLLFLGLFFLTHDSDSENCVCEFRCDLSSVFHKFPEAYPRGDTQNYCRVFAYSLYRMCSGLRNLRGCVLDLPVGAFFWFLGRSSVGFHRWRQLVSTKLVRHGFLLRKVAPLALPRVGDPAIKLGCESGCRCRMHGSRGECSYLDYRYHRLLSLLETGTCSARMRAGYDPCRAAELMLLAVVCKLYLSRSGRWLAVLDPFECWAWAYYLLCD
nr:hypothetical protein [Tanacetum cinerariifolium]